jgi:hypothetical protein
MSFPTFDREPERKKKHNIFKSLLCFKYFFDDKETFRDLSEYYNREKFKHRSVGAGNKIMKYLKKKGFEPVLIEDTSNGIVKIGRFKT